MMKLIILLGVYFLISAIYTEYLKQTGNQRKSVNITHATNVIGFVIVFSLFIQLLANIRKGWF